MATPVIVSPRPRMIENVPASAANIATSKSNRLGRVRDRISAVCAFSGDSNTINAVNRIASKLPTASAISDRRNS